MWDSESEITKEGTILGTNMKVEDASDDSSSAPEKHKKKKNKKEKKKQKKRKSTTSSSSSSEAKDGLYIYNFKSCCKPIFFPSEAKYTYVGQ